MFRQGIRWWLPLWAAGLVLVVMLGYAGYALFGPMPNQDVVNHIEARDGHVQRESRIPILTDTFSSRMRRP
jgi:hypothetical protein